MKIYVKLFGTLRRFSLAGNPGEWFGELDNQSTLKDLMAVIGTTEKEVLTASINGSIAPLDMVLHEGDEVIMVTPMGGG